MALITRFAAVSALVFSFSLFFACQKTKQPPALSAAFRQLPDSIFSGKLPPAVFAARLQHLPTGVDVDTAFIRVLFGEVESMELAVLYYNEYEKMPQIGDPTRSWIDLQRGDIFSIQGRPDSARLFYEKAETRARAGADSANISMSLILLADLDMEQNRPISAGNRLAEALPILRASGDSIGQLNASRALAQCHIIQKDWKKAETAARDGLTFSTKKAVPDAAVALESGLTIALLEQKKHDEAAVLIQKNLGLTASGNLLFYRGGWLMYFARMRLAQKKPLEALDSLRAAERLPAEIANIPQAACLREQLFSEGFAAIGQKKEAVARAEKSLKLAEMIRNLPKQALAAGALSNLLEADGQMAAAFQSLKKYRSLSDSIYQSNEKGHFQDLLEIEKADAHKREVITLAAVADQERQRKWFVGTFGLFAAVGIVVSARLRQKNELFRTEKAASEQAALLRQAEAEMALQREQLEDFTRFIVEKNQQIEALTLPSSSRNASTETEDVEALYSQNIFTDNDWERFKTYFERVHPGFLARLRHQFPELSPAETRLFFLLKMGMSMREMASMLGVSAESIKKGRYRLRKKLELEDEQLETVVGGI